MKNNFKKEISEMEENDQLNESEKNHKQDSKIIAIVEMYDSFYWIEDICLVDDTEEVIKKIKDKYHEFKYQVEFKIYRVNEYKDDFKKLLYMNSLGNEGEKLIQDWMRKNKKFLIEI